MAKKKKKTTAARKTLIVLCVVLGIILAALVAGTVYAEYLLGKVNYVDSEATTPTLSQEEIDALYQPDEDWEEGEETEPEEVEFFETEPDEAEEAGSEETLPVFKTTSDNIKTFLLIGADDSEENGVSRTDSIILCTFNKTKKTITLTSFMRDIYVDIPGYKKNRINVPYSLGGLSLLHKTLEKNFGVVPDGTVIINFNNFVNLIDYVGGIEIELTSQEAKYIRQQYSGADTVEGVNLLNGWEALFYSRYRRSGGGDLDRTNRQRIVLSTLLHKYKNLSKAELLGVMDDVLPMVTTDMSKEDILGYFLSFFPMLAEAELVSTRIPVDNGYYLAKREGMSVVVADMAKNRKHLQSILTE